MDRLIQRILATEDEEFDCEQVAELIVGYVDMQVAGEAATQLLPKVKQHIGQCDACADLYETLLEVVLLEEKQALPDVDDLLDEIVAGDVVDSAAARPMTGAPSLTILPDLPDERPEPAGDRDQPSGALIPIPLTRWTWVARHAVWGWLAAAAALIAVVILGAWGQSQASEAARLRADLEFIARAERVIWMHGTEYDPDATGHVFMGNGDDRVLLVIDSLNPLPDDRVYQLWVTTETEDMLSVGTFSVGAEGEGRIWTELRPLPSNLASMFITPEPTGGSAHPTSDVVCAWGDRL